MAVVLEYARRKIIERTRALQRAIELQLPPEIVHYVRGQLANYQYAAQLLEQESQT